MVSIDKLVSTPPLTIALYVLLYLLLLLRLDTKMSLNISYSFQQLGF